MDASQIVLKLVLDQIELPAKIDDFSERLLLQKKIYLSQLTGVDLGYRFGWYIRGPYSSDLAEDAFRLVDDVKQGDDDYKGKSLNSSVRERLSKAKSIWGNCPTGVKDTDWLELLASLHFLVHIAFLRSGKDRSFVHVHKSLIDSKPQFKDRDEDIQSAWDHLEEVGLIENKLLS